MSNGEKKVIRKDPQEYRINRDGRDLQDYDPEQDGGLRRYDPYRGMGNASDDTRPDFLKDPKGVASGERDSNGESSSSEFAGDEDSSYGKMEKNREAARGLAESEKDALNSSPEAVDDSISGVRENEEGAEGFYSGKDEIGKKKNRKTRRGGIGFKGILKKRAPILAIFMTIAGVGGAMFGAQTLLPFAIEELLIEKFNSIGISATIVSDELLDLQLNQGVRQGAPDPTKTDTMFGLSEYQVQQYKLNGIDVFEIEVDGKKGATMVYKKHDTDIVPVVGSDILGSAEVKDIKTAVAKASGYSKASLKKPIGTDDALSDKDFYLAYNSASKVWRNGASGWFDGIMKSVTEVKLNVTRGRWANYAARSITNAGNSMKEYFNEVAGGTKVDIDDNGVEVSSDTINEVEVTEYKKDGGVEVENKTLEVDQKLSKNTTASKIGAVLESKAVKAAQTAASVVCGAVKAMVVIYGTVQAYQTVQFLNLVSGFLESVDRVKSGHGDTSPMDQYVSNMTVASTTSDGKGNVVRDGEKRSAIASAGMSWLFGSRYAIDSNDTSVANVNIESITGRITNLADNVGTITKALEICGYVAMASATIDLIADAVMLVASFGVGNVIKFIAKKLAQAAIGAALSIVISVLVTSVINQIVNVMKKNVATEWFGEDLGNAIISGASKYLGGNGTSGGQGPGTVQATTAYLVKQQEVIAKEAEYQRATRSPFDIRSRHTFLGSLAYAIIPLAYSGGGIMSFLTSAASTATSMITAMLPTANAIDTESMLNSKGECPLLEGANIAADAFCNPYIITDVTTTGNSAVAVANGVKNEIDSSGKIKTDSDLARYVTYCGQRTSPYNLYDATIASQISGEVSPILSGIPFAGDAATIVGEAIKAANVDWITGRGCVVGGGSWSGNKNYQRYAEDQRLLEGMNPNYTSPVTAYLTDYYKENPIDTSFEGTLARYSGQTKEDVELALDLMDYYQFLDEYDPSTRYAFIKEEEPKKIYYETSTRIATISETLATEYFRMVHPELRSRYYAV